MRRGLVPTPSTAALRLDCANVPWRGNGLVWGFVRGLVSGRGGAPRTGVRRGNTPTPTTVETTLSRGAQKRPTLWSQKQETPTTRAQAGKWRKTSFVVHRRRMPATDAQYRHVRPDGQARYSRHPDDVCKSAATSEPPTTAWTCRPKGHGCETVQGGAGWQGWSKDRTTPLGGGSVPLGAAPGHDEAPRTPPRANSLHIGV
jgi:hypothetical protein